MIPAVVSSWGSVKAAAAAVENGWWRRWGFLVRWLRRREVKSFEVIVKVLSFLGYRFGREKSEIIGVFCLKKNEEKGFPKFVGF